MIFPSRLFATVLSLTVGVALINSSDAVASTPASSQETGAVVVGAQTAAVAASQTGGIVASAVGGALGVGGPTPTTVGSQMNYFNSRSLAGKSAGGASKRAGIWAQGGWTTADNNEAGGQFDGDIFNFVAGIDYKPRKFNGNLLIGLAFGYEDVDITTSFNNGTFEGNGFTIAPYFGYKFNKAWGVDASVGVSFLDYDNSRNSNGVTGSFNAKRLFGSANFTGNIQRKKLRITPKVGILALGEEQDSYSESDGTAVGDVNIHLIRLNASGELGYSIAKGVEPFLRAGLEYDLNRNGPVVLTGTTLSSSDEAGAAFAAGINFNRKNISGSITGTSTQFKDELTTWGASARIRINF